MAPFDPISALLGGALIGVASALLLFLNGRIAGISGIFGDFLDAGAAERGWRIAFLVGLIAAPLALAAVGRPMPLPDMPTSWAVIIGGGLLVGVGTRLSGGCTSGHGICGLARLSPRSIAATGIFMVVAIIVVAIVRHGLGA
ncbi:MAG: YeeE/YedE thiosulfate transporter family protein [Xanthobacteraceae bacterium]